MSSIEIKVVCQEGVSLPQAMTLGASGVDICAFLESPKTLQPLERVLIPTGISVEIPQGFEIQVRPRSGLAIKHGVTVLNTPGTVDSDYRGEIKIILVNLGQEAYTIMPQERIAQFVLAKVEHITWKNSSTLSDTERKTGGFGHTGK